jgi:large subunit ribosomal protein L32
MRRAHDSISGASLTIDSETGETHRRHHVSLDGLYRGKEVLKRKEDSSDDE